MSGVQVLRQPPGIAFGDFREPGDIEVVFEVRQLHFSGQIIAHCPPNEFLVRFIFMRFGHAPERFDDVRRKLLGQGFKTARIAAILDDVVQRSHDLRIGGPAPLDHAQDVLDVARPGFIGLAGVGLGGQRDGVVEEAPGFG